MAIYLLLYHGDQLPEEESKKREIMADCDRSNREIGNSLLDGGNHIEKSKCITVDTIQTAENKDITAYRIIEAADIDEVVELSRGAPAMYDGGRADVYKILEPVA